MQTPSVNPIIDLERHIEKILKKGENIAITCHNTTGDNVSGSPIMEDHLKSGFSGKTTLDV